MKEGYYKDDLKNTNWLGEVVDIEDPKELGRVRIKVFGKFDELEVEHIPWARPANNYSASSSTGGGYHSVPKMGSIVNVNFDNGNIYSPEYTFTQKISDELKEEISGDNYATAQSLIYDTEIEGGLKIFYTESRGLMIKLGETMMNLHRDKTITITNKSDDDYADGEGNSIVIDPEGNLNIDMDTDWNVNIGGDSTITVEGDVTLSGTNIVIDHSASIELGSGATEKIVLGNLFMDTVFNTHVHTGNLGAPTSPPIVPMTVAVLSSAATPVTSL